MALSADFINQLLKNYVASASGKKAVDKHLKLRIADLVRAGVEHVPDIQKCVDQAVNYLCASIRTVIPDFDMHAIYVSNTQTVDGDVYVYLSLAPGEVWRDSLSPYSGASGWKNYSTRSGRYGTDNIVLQFAKGWDTGMKSVFGYWHGHMTQSTYKREPNDFLETAVHSLNQALPSGVSAQLLEPYK